MKDGIHYPLGHYEYRFMPYGLSNSPTILQGFMNEVFQKFLHRFVIVYIDNILIYSWNLAEHRHHVTQVLHQLRKHHLYLKLEKCEFHCPRIQCLGYILSRDGIQMDQGQDQAIRDWPQCHVRLRAMTNEEATRTQNESTNIYLQK